MDERLSLALARGAVTLPEGPVLLLRPPADLSFDELPLEACTGTHGFRPAHDALAARGLAMADAPEGPFAAAVVFVPRARALALDLLAQAIGAVGVGGLVVVDGAKADGIEAILKAVRAAAPVGEVMSKAHGKVFAFAAPDAVPEGWAAQPRQVDGFVTAPGVFSADGIDPGSALLAAHLTALKGRVCDLGAGWGYLGRTVLASEAVTALDLVEAERAALDCARLNVTDPRAAFHWADATVWTGGAYDTVISNPPFHASRRADPDLGRAFVSAAARLMAPSGRFLMVANRHLPYEAALEDAFAERLVIEERDGYKVVQGRKPRRAGRTR
ncbi:methyltransferase [uncultured Jannaschia sp.]|uniref:class I SAM-dependent methyltransferase n=1 Tax=uncultured Jannaschia sp. TaxID=293347 RepID=UPI00260B722B|nr:methyltransferase [uncultured Jannaschia sp.]